MTYYYNEPSPECDAQKPGSNEFCTKAAGHGGKWHGNLNTFWIKED